MTPLAEIASKFIRAFVAADFVRKYGRPPLSSDEINQHHALWMLENGKAVSSKVKRSLKNLPTNVAQVMRTLKGMKPSKVHTGVPAKAPATAIALDQNGNPVKK